MNFMQSKYFILVLFIILTTSCHTNYYYYSYDAHHMLRRGDLYLVNTNGERVKLPTVQVTPSGRLYTMMCSSKKEAKSYLWEDKMLVEKRRMTKLQVYNHKTFNKLINELRKDN